MPIISNFPAKVENDDRYLQLSGASAMTGALNMGGNKITNVAEPQADGDAANKEYVDNELTIALVGNYIPVIEKGKAGGVAELDENGKLDDSQKPTYTAAEVGARPSTWTPSATDVGAIPSSEKGAVSGVATLDTNGKLTEAQKPTYTADEVGARPNTWTPSAADVGAIPATEKGASSGVATLGTDGKVPAGQLPEMDYVPNSEVGVAGGVAELDSSGKVPVAQLPSYVDDVVEYDSQSAFPGTGESGKIYVALDTNLTYRWGGTEYVEISPSLALGETEGTAYRGDRGKAAYDHSQVTSGNPHGTTAADVGARPDTWMPSAEDVGALTQDQADERYLQMQGTTTVASSIGTAPYTIEFTEETDEVPILTFGAQSVATSAWATDTTYEGWGFRAAVALSGVTADYVPSVTFGIVDATSGNLAPVADTYAGGVYIYAKEQPTSAVSIASVVCCKGV